jgi:hypothetical protein
MDQSNTNNNNNHNLSGGFTAKDRIEQSCWDVVDM